MKKILYFLQWQWRQFETWQKFWMLAMFLFGASLSASEERRPYFLYSALAIVLAFVLKWVLYDGIRNAWIRFNEEQQKLVDIMKDSPK